MDRLELKNLLGKFHLRPHKNLGQNFLIDEEILAVIIKKAGVNKGDKIIEIGPGLGALTQALLAKKAEIMAIEFDKRYFEILKQRYKNELNLKLIYGDALAEITKIKLEGYKIIANLPYQITSPFFRKILSQKNLPKLIVVMVQKEMAERIVALPHNSKRGFLSVLIQLYGKPRIEAVVPRECFYPQPKVDSAVLKMPVRPWGKNAEKAKVIKIVQAGFSQKRKKIRNSIAAALGIEAQKAEKMIRDSGINSDNRAEDLEINQWLRLTDNFREVL